MIQSKKDYLYYLECDKVAMRKTRKHPAYKHDIIWTFERLLRKCEYYENCKKGLISRIYAKFLKLRYVNLSQRLGFSIGFNTCGPGLCLEHYGNIGINQHAKIGCNCRIIGGVVIGATESNKVPTIGDNVFIGFGAAIVGAVTIELLLELTPLSLKTFLHQISRLEEFQQRSSHKRDPINIL